MATTTSIMELRMRAYTKGLVALGVALASALPAAAGAQTFFAWPDTAVDVATYATVEDCQAIVRRARYTAESRNDLVTAVWSDTLPLDPQERIAPQPTSVTETARHCMARFAAVDSVPLSAFSALLPLYLHAEWDDKARALVERRIAAIALDARQKEGAVDAGAELAAAIDTVVEVALGRGVGQGVQPKRGALAYDVVMEHLPNVPDRLTRLRIYQRVAIVSSDGELEDLERLERLLARMATIHDSLTDRERGKLEEEYGVFADGGNLPERYAAALRMSLGKEAFLDSLRRSTSAYVAVKHDNWVRATGLRPETYGLGNPLGEHAPPIEGDIWLGREDGSGPRPTPGRVSLVVFLNAGECVGVVESAAEMDGGCAGSLTTLRRLMERFPALEVTVVAETQGYFMFLKDSITPAREAELTKRWLESYGVTAPLAMSRTDAWRLPSPDGRRVARLGANRANYSFGKSWQVSNRNAYLVDENGIVVHVREMDRFSVAQDFAELVGILLERQVAGR